jgi:hypothetical protein
VSDPADIHGGNAVAEGRHSEVHDELSVRSYPKGPRLSNEPCPACHGTGGSDKPDKDWLRWNGGVVLKFVTTIYSDRRIADMPILANGLEEAGCTDEAILEHCRVGTRESDEAAVWAEVKDRGNNQELIDK